MTAPTLGVIGTAGRDKTKPMTRQLYTAMCSHLWDLIHQYGEPINLVSGGAAWADHVAITVWLEMQSSNHPNIGELTLHLPAMWDTENHCYVDTPCGGTSNHYHRKFSKVMYRDMLADIGHVLNRPGCRYTMQVGAVGMGPFFARNSEIARDSDFLLAFTWGQSEDRPADGGTLDTWNKCRGIKSHVPLHTLQA